MERIYPLDPGDSQLRVWQRGSRGHPPGALPDSPRGLRTRLGLRTLNGARPPAPAQLTDSADTQATKTQVSRIQARRTGILRDRWLPAARLQRGEHEAFAQRPALLAQKDQEQSCRSDRGSGDSDGTRGLGLLERPLPPAACSRTAAPSHLLAPSLPEAGLWLRAGEAAWRLCRSAVVLPPRTPASLCRCSVSDSLRNKLDGLECSCS